MAFYEMLPLAGKIGFVSLMVIWALRLWSNRRKALKQYPDVSYQPDTSTESWQWALPPKEVGLEIRRTEDQSWLMMNPVRSSNEVVFSILGAGLFLLALYLMGLSLFREFTQEETMLAGSFIMGAVMVFLALGLCSVDAPVVAIGREPWKLIIRKRFAVVFLRDTRFRAGRAPSLTADGKVQGFLEMNTDQLDRLPDYYLYIGRKWWFKKRFLMRCTPSQGSWITGGINEWAALVK